MTSQTKLQKERDAEGKEIAGSVQALLNMIEGKLTKKNEAWLATGDKDVLTTDPKDAPLNPSKKKVEIADPSTIFVPGPDLVRDKVDGK